MLALADIARVEGASRPEAFQFRLVTADDLPRGGSPDAETTRVYAFHHWFEVRFELRPADTGHVYQGCVFAALATEFWTYKPGPGPIAVGASTWSASAELRAGGHEENQNPWVPLPLEFQVDDDTIRWTIDRKAAFENQTILSPDEAWVLQRVYAQTGTRAAAEGGAADATLRWATGHGWPAERWDRAPDEGYARTPMTLPRTPEAPAEEPLQEDGTRPPVAAAPEPPRTVHDDATILTGTSTGMPAYLYPAWAFAAAIGSLGFWYAVRDLRRTI